MPRKTIKQLILLTLVTVTALTCINPIYPNEQFLQHLGTLLVGIPLVLDLKKDRLSLFSYAFVGLFILLHVIGARWIYSKVPYDDWLNFLFNLDLSHLWGGRNHYDRLVHFSFGVLFFPFLYETIRQRKLAPAPGLLMAWLALQTISMAYEIFEWLLTVLLSSEAAEGYNGQQGDAWDAQKDMALAMVGSTLMCIAYVVNHKQRKKPLESG